MDYKICYKNNDKIVRIYNYLNSNIGKIIFINKIKILKEKNNKIAMLTVIKRNWQQYYKLIKIIKEICLRIIRYELGNPILLKFSINLYKTLDKINTPLKLHKFIYKLLYDKTLYQKVTQIYGILSDKYKCTILLRNL